MHSPSAHDGNMKASHCDPRCHHICNRPTSHLQTRITRHNRFLPARIPSPSQWTNKKARQHQVLVEQHTRLEQTPRRHVFSGTHHNLFQISLLFVAISVFSFEVESNLNGSRLPFCVRKCIIVVSHLFWFVIHFTDTDGTVYTHNTFFNIIFASNS